MSPRTIAIQYLSWFGWVQRWYFCKFGFVVLLGDDHSMLHFLFVCTMCNILLATQLAQWSWVAAYFSRWLLSNGSVHLKWDLFLQCLNLLHSVTGSLLHKCSYSRSSCLVLLSALLLRHRPIWCARVNVSLHDSMTQRVHVSCSHSLVYAWHYEKASSDFGSRL